MTQRAFFPCLKPHFRSPVLVFAVFLPQEYMFKKGQCDRAHFCGIQRHQWSNLHKHNQSPQLAVAVWADIRSLSPILVSPNSSICKRKEEDCVLIFSWKCMRQGLEIDENPDVFFPDLWFLVAPIAFRTPVREHYINPERGASYSPSITFSLSSAICLAGLRNCSQPPPTLSKPSQACEPSLWH